MERIPSPQRPDWRERVERVGLVFPTTDLPDGGAGPYWFEQYC